MGIPSIERLMGFTEESKRGLLRICCVFIVIAVINLNNLASHGWVPGGERNIALMTT